MDRRTLLRQGAAYAFLSSRLPIALGQIESPESAKADSGEIRKWIDAAIAKEISESNAQREVSPSGDSGKPPALVLMPKRPAPPKHKAPVSVEAPLAITPTTNGDIYSQVDASDIDSSTIIIRGPRNLGTFADDQPMFYTLNEITVGDITVPPLFVTDLTSIPRVFFDFLRPDGPYAYAAIVHDWLYWKQTGRREDADWLLKLGMEAFNVGELTVDLIYNTVRSQFGQMAWNENAKLKASGEKRRLKVAPTDPRTKWSDWKRIPSHFV